MASDPILPLNTRTRSSTLATDRLSVLVRHVSPDPSAPVMPKSAQTPAACGVAAAADSQPIDVSGTPAQPAGGLYSSLSQAVGRGWRSLRSEVAAELQLRHLRHRPEEARQLVQLDRSASVAEIHHALVEDGAVIIRELIDPATVDRVRQELAEITESQKAEGRLQHTGPPGSFVGDKTERTREFLHRSRAAQELLTHPVVISAMERLMGANCKRFRLKVATHIDIGPGETAQPLHREDGLYPAAHPGSEWCCDCMWALSDFTPENGATHIVRASHKGPQDTSGRVGYEHTAQAAMPKGSCLIFTGSTVHAGGGNVTADERRQGLLLGYVLGWLSQEQNPYVTVTPDIARTLDPTVQDLLGYPASERGESAYNMSLHSAYTGRASNSSGAGIVY